MHQACAAAPRKPAGLDGTVFGVLVAGALALALVVGVVAVTAVERKPVTSAPARAEPSLAYREAGQHWKGQQSWVIITVSPNPEVHHVVELAEHLHAQRPEQHFRIFDDASPARIKAYVEYEDHYGKPEGKRYPYPEAWLTEHQVGRVTYLIGDGWTLIDARGEKIVSLE